MKDCGGWKEWLEKSGKVRIKNALKVNTLRAYAEFLRRGRDCISTSNIFWINILWKSGKRSPEFRLGKEHMRLFNK
jgi:hypothetical protein